MTGSSSLASQPERQALIPYPAKYNVLEGSFTIGPKTAIYVVRSEMKTARVLAEAIARSTGMQANISTESNPTSHEGAITLTLDAGHDRLGDEGYTLKITPKGVLISAAKSAGLFYGVQTFRQLLPLGPIPGQTEYRLACVSIEDKPRFGWRGYMVDSSRHFITKATILKLLDALAMAKINTFHWHLVDDHAWRLAISKYPDLVKPIPGIWNTPIQSMGYYSASDIREVVERAKRLHITIVPEIEMPGHATQAASVLAEASCLGPDGKPLPPGSTRQICLGSDKAIAQLQDILIEIMTLFPNSPYIHLGGDEAKDEHWKVCSHCKARMDQLGITNARLLQKWFMNKMSRFVHEQGRKSMAWADRLSLGIPEGQIVHCWHSGELEEAVAKGFFAVNSQHDYTYFDYGQGHGDTFYLGESLDLARVYSFDPLHGLTPEQRKFVLGVQAQLWTEVVTDERVFVKTFPRILALAEVGWIPQENRDSKDFTRRLQAFLPRLEAMDIPYFKPGVVLGSWKPEMLSQTWKNLDWDITGKIKKPGPLGVELIRQQGKHDLQIQSVTLLVDGQEISRDEHEGCAGYVHYNNLYHVKIDTLKPGATYTLRAEVRGDSDTNSTGVVLLR